MLGYGMSVLMYKRERGKALSGQVTTWTRSGNGRKLRESVEKWTNSKRATDIERQVY